MSSFSKGRDLTQIPKSLDVTNYHVDCFQETMVGLGLDENVIDEILITKRRLKDDRLTGNQFTGTSHSLFRTPSNSNQGTEVTITMFPRV